jgi:hypothetical protein
MGKKGNRIVTPFRILCFSSSIFPSDGACTTLCKRLRATSTHSYSLISLGSINLVSKMAESEDGKSSVSMPPAVPVSIGATDEDGF